MNSLRINDNSSKKKKEFSDILNLTNKIVDKTLWQLEKEGIFVFPQILNDAEDITEEQMVLHSLNDSYYAENVMGFIGYGDERLIISSRFSDDNNDFFFQYLLETVIGMPNIVNLETDFDHDSYIFNILLFLFPIYLKAAMRKGVFKKYIRREYNNEAVKGTIDIARHIKLNTPFTGKIAYSQREFSYDNYLTELVRHTIEFIKQKPFGNNILNKAKDEVKLILEATPGYQQHSRQKIINENTKNTIRHAYFREYLALQRLCLLILRHRKHRIGAGVRQIYGILFDGSWLWEEYINTLIGEKYNNTLNGNKFYHPMNKAEKNAQVLFNGKKGSGKIYPDFISQNSSDRIIADAKYKPDKNIGNKDYLQLLAYMFRFDSKIGYYLYSETENKENKRLWLNKGSSYEHDIEPRNDISVTKLGLLIPSNTHSYLAFKEEIHNNEQAFKKIILK